MRTLIFLFYMATLWTANAEPKQIWFFIALCDNKTQGIVLVGEKKETETTRVQFFTGVTSA